MRQNTKYLIIGASVVAIALVVGLTFYSLKRGNSKKKIKNAAKLAKLEYDSWGKGSIKEGNSDTIQRLRDYWKKGVKINNSDSWYINTAWSAAFTSFVMRESGFDDFKFNASHSVYIRDSIKNKKQNLSGFKGYKPNETKVEVGDLVCYPRQAGVTYDTQSAYASHCDIIVEIENNKAIGVGGNVSNSVSQTTYPLSSGKIDKAKDSKSYGGVFVVIKPPK
jgi:hypothetical protein